MHETEGLVPLVRKYIEYDAASVARTLETLSEENAFDALNALPPELAAKALTHLQVSYAAAMLAKCEPDRFSAIVKKLETKRAATIFMHLPEDARERFKDHVPEKLKFEIRELLTYPEHSVGRIMSTSFYSFNKNTKVKEAIRKMRSPTRRKQPGSYTYVLDDDNRLVGVINIHNLLLADPDDTLESATHADVFALHCFTDIADAGHEMAKRKYFAAPVVDNEGRMLGIIKGEQLLKDIKAETSQDILKMVGAGSDERAFSPLSFSLKKRLPWLHVNLATAFLAAGVVALFEDVIARITVLAVFLPVVAGQGGNGGAQSLAIVMRGLVMREVPKEKILRLIGKEGFLGLCTGAATGLVTAAIVYVWQGNAYLGLVIGLGMIINLFFAGLAGASIPLTMKALRLDPAQCSSIILTTVTDVVGFFAFLTLALAFEPYLA